MVWTRSRDLCDVLIEAKDDGFILRNVFQSLRRANLFDRVLALLTDPSCAFHVRELHRKEHVRGCVYDQHVRAPLRLQQLHGHGRIYRLSRECRERVVDEVVWRNPGSTIIVHKDT